MTIKPVNIDNIPPTLKCVKRWLLWKWENNGEGKLTKVPYRNLNERGSSTNPDDWSEFDQVITMHKWSRGEFGVGFVLCKKDKFVCIDVDHFKEMQGEHKQFLIQILREVNSYTEVSVSGTGLHIICNGTKPGNRCRSKEWPGFEIYDDHRFITMTGQAGTHSKFLNPADVSNIYYKLFPKIEKEKENQPDSPTLEDVKILKKAFNAKNGEKFKKFYNNDNLGSDESSNDMIFVSMLAFYTQDIDQLIRIWRGSKLWRIKLEREDYVKRTVEKALENNRKTYQQHATPDHAEATAEVEDSEQVKPEKITGKKLYRFSQLFEKFDTEHHWVIQDRIMQGKLIALTGDSKAGKSTVCLNLMVGMIYDGKVLGKDCNPTEIIYLDFENDTAYEYQHVAAALAGRNIALLDEYAWIGNYEIDDPEYSLPKFLTVEYLEEITQAKKPGLIFVDTMRGAFNAAPHQGNWERDESQIRELFAPFLQWCHKTKWTLVILHHNNRQGNFAGSADIKAAVDVLIEMEIVRENNHPLGEDLNIRRFRVCGRCPAATWQIEYKDGRIEYVDEIEAKNRQAEQAQQKHKEQTGEDYFAICTALEGLGGTARFNDLRNKLIGIVGKNKLEAALPNLKNLGAIESTGGGNKQRYCLLPTWRTVLPN